MSKDKKPLAFRLMVDPENVRRAVVLISGKVMSDEEINEMFFDREPVDIDLAPELTGVSSLETAVGFVALMIAKEGEEDRPSGKFAQKMAEMLEASRKKV